MTITEAVAEFFKHLKHTPGPWEAMPNQSNHGETICIQNKAAWMLADVLIPFEKDEPEALANSKLISCAPEMLRSICITYLTLLVKFAYGQNDFCTSARISLDGTLADLRNKISLATGLEGKYVQEWFESKAQEVAN